MALTPRQYKYQEDAGRPVALPPSTKPSFTLARPPSASLWPNTTRPDVYSQAQTQAMMMIPEAEGELSSSVLTAEDLR